MSRTIDEKVVEMRFDNRQFESNVKTSMSTLDKLKQSLKLTDAAKGFESVNNAAKSFDISPLSSGVETVKAKFSALEVMAVTALANITNSAVNAGKRLVSAFTIEPIKSGFQEYETQINAVQTILANTKSKGTTLDQVNEALDELNHYADKTIYNFTEMTRNIGTFTAAGVDLETSVNAIQGIANLAAVSGSTSQQASTAMYQLSQALATGTIRLMDWNSVVNAGMGGQVFQDALKETSKELNTGAEAAIKAKGSFRESLQTGWLTSQVLTETLKKFTGSGAIEYVSKYTGLSSEAVQAALDSAKAQYGEANAIEYASKALAEKSGKNADEIKSTLEFAKTAEDAATKVKTFSQLMDTLKEAAQSGWTQTWEIIIGDFEQAKSLWTSISDYFNDVINKSAEARNELLEKWANVGGRTMLFDGIKSAFEGILSILKPIKEAFREVFPPITLQQLVNVTKGFKNLAEKLKISEETADKLKRTFKGIFSVFDIVKKAVSTVAKAIANLLGSEGVGSLADFLLGIAASIGDFFTSLNEGFNTNGVSGILSKVISGISTLLKRAVDSLSSFGDAFSSVGKTISKVASEIWGAIKKAFGWIADNVSVNGIFKTIGAIFGALTGKQIFESFKSVKDFIQGIISKFGNKEKTNSIKEQITDLLNSVHDSLQSFTSGIKVTSLVAIASAIGILAASMGKISELSVPDVIKSMSAIGVGMAILCKGLKSVTSTVSTFDSESGIFKVFNSKDIVKATLAMVLMAEAIKVLADAIEKIGKLSLKEIAKGLVGVGGGLSELIAGLKFLDAVKVSLRTSIAMIALAKACEILGDAMQKFSGMQWDEIGRGLTGMGGALAELVGSLSVLNKVGGGGAILGSVGILIVVQTLEKMSDGLKKFGEMTWDEIKHGLTAMGGALAELVTSLGILRKVSGFSGIFSAGSILIVIQGMEDLANALKKFGEMQWDEISRGLTGMGGALTELGLAIGIVNKLSKNSFGGGLFGSIFGKYRGMGGSAGFSGELSSLSGIFSAGSIWIVIQGLQDLAEAFKKFGEMNWDEIARGLTGMGGALAEVAGVTGTLGKLAGLSSLLGAGSLLLAIQGLGDLANAFKVFAKLSWEEVKNGLVGMGGALTEVATISGVLGTVAGLAGLIGGGSILLVIQGLGDLADAFKKFGEMSWDEIGRGLSAMGGALGETALGGVLNTLSGFGASAISEMSTSLGDLAYSVKKWTGVTVPEGLGTQLGTLASGVNAFMFSGSGAEALTTAAPGVGIMADSVKKWTGVTVPDGLGTKLGTLASGINTFAFSGMGADALATAAPAVGLLADSIKKWSNVSIPENLESKLKGIANGIKAFSFAFLGGVSLNAIVGPIGSLADSIKKWSGVSVPEGIGDDLKEIASGVKAFSFAFMGGWSIAALVEPLKSLADSVNKWNGISVPDDLGDQLTALANGVKAFSFAFMGGWSISAIVSSLSDLGDAVKKWSNVAFPENLGTNLSDLADGIKSFEGIDDISEAVASCNSVIDLVEHISTVDTSNVENFKMALQELSTIDLQNFANSFGTAGQQSTSNLSTGLIGGIPSVTGAVASLFSSGSQTAYSRVGQFSNAGTLAGTGIGAGIGLSMPSVISATGSVISGALQRILSSNGQFTSSGASSMTSLSGGIRSGNGSVMGATGNVIGGAIQAILSRGGQFTSSGNSSMNNLRGGISSGLSTVSSAASEVAQGAVNAADGHKSDFTSIGQNMMEGLKGGILDKAASIAEAAVSAVKGAINAAKEALGIASPSKVFAEMGRFTDQGYINGIVKLMPKVASAASSMAQSAIDGASTIVSNVGSIPLDSMDYQPTIHPVVDMNSINADHINLGSSIDVSMIKPINSLSQIVSDAQSDIDASNQKVIDAVNGLRDDLNVIYNSEEKEIALYVDSKKLASTLAKPMNRQLNILSKRGAY